MPVPLKHQYTSTRLHSITLWKTATFNFSLKYGLYQAHAKLFSFAPHGISHRNKCNTFYPWDICCMTLSNYELSHIKIFMNISQNSSLFCYIHWFLYNCNKATCEKWFFLISWSRGKITTFLTNQKVNIQVCRIIVVTWPSTAGQIALLVLCSNNVSCSMTSGLAMKYPCIMYKGSFSAPKQICLMRQNKLVPHTPTQIIYYK